LNIFEASVINREYQTPLPSFLSPSNPYVRSAFSE
jgi:hypothetical protein